MIKAFSSNDHFYVLETRQVGHEKLSAQNGHGLKKVFFMQSGRFSLTVTSLSPAS
jgi:hypothetical protein